MTHTGLQKFTLHLQQALSEPWEFTCPDNYIRLDQVNEVTEDNLNEANGLPGPDPLVDAFNLIINQAQNLYTENIVFGINEIFKYYLKKLNQENQRIVTTRVMDCIKMLFLFITEDRFPYTEKIWEAISSMSKPVGLFLIKRKFTEAAPVFFEFAASLGKQASRKGLSTGTLQHAFRISELACRNTSGQELSSLVRNLRQNLEN
ncbi:MAG: hypothetical protein AAGU27_04200 [Dehalobacterium sp.]